RAASEELRQPRVPKTTELERPRWPTYELGQRGRQVKGHHTVAILPSKLAEAFDTAHKHIEDTALMLLEIRGVLNACTLAIHEHSTVEKIREIMQRYEGRL